MPRILNKRLSPELVNLVAYLTIASLSLIVFTMLIRT